jgi:hypothetical protein
MSSPPIPPSTYSVIPEVTFLKAHEKLIIVIVLIIGILIGLVKGLDAWYSIEKLKSDQLAQQVVADQKQIAATQLIAAQLQKSAVQDKATLTATVQAVTTQNARISAQNASLAAQNVALTKSTAVQQAKDATLTLPQLGSRITQLVPGVNPKDFTVSADGKDAAVGVDTAQKVVSQLELVPDLQAQNANLTTENTGLTSELASEEKLSAEQTAYEAILEKEVAAQTTVIADQQKKIDDAQKLCNQQIATEKTNSKKKFVSGLKWGAGIGLGIAIAVAHFL